jgi:exopolyphosphatase/guanosine-5'-triphosphate,3'-diphosphate pyrophosphatase
MPGLSGEPSSPAARPNNPRTLVNPATSQRRAVIDIGTNSVKLLVADIENGRLTPVSETSTQTRLGAGFYRTRILQPSAIQLTAAAVKEFAKAAADLGASQPRLIATSAARDALNVIDLARAIEQSADLRMEVLSGDKEAEWVFRGVTSDPRLSQSPTLVLDVGGGSTEFVVGDKMIPQFRSSYNLGTVRLLEELRPDDPPGLRQLIWCRVRLREYLRDEVRPVLKPALAACRGPVQLVGTGGTATILARIVGNLAEFDREKIESTVITRQKINELAESHWQMSLAERQKIIGLPPKRADVILTGLAIYEAIMEQFLLDSLVVSTRGLRYWALLQ